LATPQGGAKEFLRKSLKAAENIRGSKKPIGPLREALGSAKVAEDASQFIPLLQQAAGMALK
jgi:hypothetical protein